MQTDQSPSREAVALREHFIAIVTDAIHDHDADREADSGRLARDHAIHAVTRILALLTPAPKPATGEVKVEQRHRDYAWSFRPSCYSGEGCRANWEAGVYDEAAPIIKAFARFERDHLTPATQPDTSTPVVFFDSSLSARRIDALENAFERCGGRVSVVGWKALVDQLRAATRPQVSDELKRAAEEATTLIDEINERASSRKFYGINQVLHAKLATVRATLVRALRTQPPQAIPDAQADGEVE